MNRKELEAMARDYSFLKEDSLLSDWGKSVYIAGFLAGRAAAANTASAWGWDEGNVGPAIAEKIKALGETRNEVPQTGEEA